MATPLKLYPPKQLGQAGATTGQGLTWDGSKWVPAAVNATQLQGRNVAATAPTDGQALAWSAGGNAWGPSSSISGAQIPYAGSYNFTAITAASIGSPTLAAGANTITLTTVCPIGVNGNDTNHYLYISGGTAKSISAISKANPAVVTSAGHGLVIGSHPGVTIAGATGSGWTAVNGLFYATVIDANTFSIPIDSTGFGTLGGAITFTIAESVLITGGTARSGVSAGTLIFTCVNAHAGAFTITSPTAGFQEMIVAFTGASLSGLMSFDPSLFYAIHAPITWPDNGGSYTLWGQNPLSFSIQKAQDFVNGNLFDHAGNANFNYITYDSVGITSFATNTSGALINLKCQYKILNCRLNAGYDHIVANGAGGEITGCVHGGAGHSCILLQKSGSTVCNDVTIEGGIMFPGLAGFAILITAADGVVIRGIIGSQASNVIWIEPPSDGVSYVASLQISNIFWDVPGAGGIVVSQTAGTIGGISVSDCQINGGSDAGHRTTQFSLFDFGSRAGLGSLINVTLTNCTGNYSQGNGFAFANATSANCGFVMVGCTSLGNGDCGVSITHAAGVFIEDCILDFNVNYGVKTASTSGVSLIGGECSGNGAGAIDVTGAAGTSAAAPWLIIDSVRGIGSNSQNVAATLTIGPEPVQTMLLGGTINTMNGGWYLRQVLIINGNAGTLTTTAGNFGATTVLAANSTKTYVLVDLGGGAKWW